MIFINKNKIRNLTRGLRVSHITNHFARISESKRHDCTHTNTIFKNHNPKQQFSLPIQTKDRHQRKPNKKKPHTQHSPISPGHRMTLIHKKKKKRTLHTHTERKKKTSVLWWWALGNLERTLHVNCGWGRPNDYMFSSSFLDIPLPSPGYGGCRRYRMVLLQQSIDQGTKGSLFGRSQDRGCQLGGGMAALFRRFLHLLGKWSVQGWWLGGS